MTAGAAFAAPAPAAAGGVALGDSDSGVADRAYIAAPPHFSIVVERQSGSFVDCGDGEDARATDASGRAMASLACGVTLTETTVIPAAAESARVVVHY